MFGALSAVHFQTTADGGKPDGGKPDGGKPDGGKPDGGKLGGDCVKQRKYPI